MSKLNQLFNLTPNKKPSKDNPIVFRRNKLLRGINKQIQNINDLKSGIKVNNVWWWNDEHHKFYLVIKYGRNEIELGKGKFSIQLNSIDEVLDSLNKIKSMTQSGFFDVDLTNLSKSIRSNFTSSSTTKDV